MRNRPGPIEGRKQSQPKTDRRLIHCSIPAELKARLMEQADSDGISATMIVVEALESFFEKKSK